MRWITGSIIAAAVIALLFTVDQKWIEFQALILVQMIMLLNHSVFQSLWFYVSRIIKKYWRSTHVLQTRLG